MEKRPYREYPFFVIPGVDPGSSLFIRKNLYFIPRFRDPAGGFFAPELQVEALCRCFVGWRPYKNSMAPLIKRARKSNGLQGAARQGFQNLPHGLFGVYKNKVILEGFCPESVVFHFLSNDRFWTTTFQDDGKNLQPNQKTR